MGVGGGGGVKSDITFDLIVILSCKKQCDNKIHVVWEGGRGRRLWTGLGGGIW